MKKFSALELIKTILLGFFFFSMMVLAAIYIMGTQASKFSSEQKLPADKMWVIVSGGTSNPYGYAINHLLPELIGYRLSSSEEETLPRGLVANRDLMSEVYLRLRPYLKQMYGEKSICKQLSEKEGETLWNDCQNRENYVYIRYHTALPYQILYAYSDDAAMTENEKIAEKGLVSVAVKEMFLVLEPIDEMRYDFYAVTRDQQNQVAVFRNSNKELFFDRTVLDAYTDNKEFLSYEFLGFDSFAKMDLQNTFPALKGESITKQIQIEPALKIAEKGNGTILTEVLKLFQYNPDKMGEYQPQDGSAIYVAGHGRLNISPDGVISYSYADLDASIDISTYLGYEIESGKYTVYDAVKASGSFADSLKRIDKRLLGEDADIGLTALYYEGEDFILEYQYFFDNIAILSSETPYALRFRIRGRNFCEITVHPFAVKNNLTPIVNFPQRWILKNMELQVQELGKEEKQQGFLKLAYQWDGTEETVFSNWILEIVPLSKKERES